MKWGIIVLILWIVILLSLLLAPINEKKLFHPFLSFKNWDKVAHFVLFFITGFIAVLSARFLSQFYARMIFGAAFGLFLAVGSEFAQSLVPYRDTSLYDLLSDVIGLGVALALCALLHRVWAFRLL